MLNATPDCVSVVLPAVRLIASSVAIVALPGVTSFSRFTRVLPRWTGPQVPKPLTLLFQSADGLLFQLASQPRSGFKACGIASNGTNPCHSAEPLPSRGS